LELESGLTKDGQMKRKRFTEEQIIAVLKEHEAGAKTADLARKHRISEATFYNWKAKYGGMDIGPFIGLIIGQLSLSSERRPPILRTFCAVI
jgi:Transposase